MDCKKCEGDRRGMLRVDDVADLLKVSPKCARRWADLGKIPQPVRIGGAVRWNEADLLAWMASGCPALRKRGPLA